MYHLTKYVWINLLDIDTVEFWYIIPLQWFKARIRFIYGLQRLDFGVLAETEKTLIGGYMALHYSSSFSFIDGLL